jgi:hypothetical protein
VLPKGLTLALGEGANVLNLVTTGKLDLSSLTVTAGDGLDQLRVIGGADAGSRVRGTASINPGDGGGFTDLENVEGIVLGTGIIGWDDSPA